MLWVTEAEKMMGSVTCVLKTELQANGSPQTTSCAVCLCAGCLISYFQLRSSSAHSADKMLITFQYYT